MTVIAAEAGTAAYGAPQVVATSPPNGAVGVRPDLDRVYIRFDRPVIWGEGICFQVGEGWQNACVIPWEDDVIHIVRQGADLPDLPPGSVQRFVLNPPGSNANCFRDMEGELLPEFSLSFTVRSGPDEPPIEPQVVSTSPPDGATGVDPWISTVSVTFSEPMDGRHSVWGAGFGHGSASWSPDMRTWSYTRDSAGDPLSPGSTVIFILNPDFSDSFRDTDGNVLQEKTFGFTVQGDQEGGLENFYNVEIARFEADPAKGFHWPYYLSVPRDAQGSAVLLVGPNNSGFPAFDHAWHDYRARLDLYWLISFAWKLNLPVLVPTFPRPPEAYIQNLERAAFWPYLPVSLQRIDLQLAAMIRDAGETLQAAGIEIQDRVFMAGFSAAGAFTSNFTVLHPELVKASASGGIGWRCVPFSSWDGIQKALYPVGIADLAELAGAPFNLSAFRGVPQYFYTGDQDTVGYLTHHVLEPADRERFGALIGEPDLPPLDVLMNAWALNEELHASAGTAARFVTYPGVGHQYTDQMIVDLQNFFRQHLLPFGGCPSIGGGCTLSGAATSAWFYGGVTADGGETFRDRFSSSESVQILMTIGPDFSDVDWPGTIHIIGALNGFWFCQDGNGNWSPWNGTLEGLVRTYSRQRLQALEPVEVAAFPLQGLEGSNFQFVAAYENSSGSIFFHRLPLAFTVMP